MEIQSIYNTLQSFAGADASVGGRYQGFTKNLKTSRYDLSTQHLSIISHSRGQLVSCRYDLFTLKHADTIHLQHASKHFRKIRYSKISSMKPLVMLSVRVEVGKFLNCK